MNFKEKLDDAVKETLPDDAVKAKRFNINECITIAKDDFLSDADYKLFTELEVKLKKKRFNAFCKSVIRNCFLIELVNDNVSSTKMRTRWHESLANDIRFATYETCLNIFTKILRKVADLPESELDVLNVFLDKTLIPYEMPIDYRDRTADPIHTVENVDLFLDDEAIVACAKMRQLIRSKTTNPEADVFKKILDKKIKVKTYLTDRAQTGEHQTNREKRWEAHPKDVQYALRRECMKIETKLLCQITMFEGCKPILVTTMKDAHFLPDAFDYVKCPIIGENIQYPAFVTDLNNPIHGKSAFQVGHLNPLKSSATAGCYGHTADNISWISEDGNRIQGSLSVSETNELLKRIYQNRPELRETAENAAF